MNLHDVGYFVADAYNANDDESGLDVIQTDRHGQRQQSLRAYTPPASDKTGAGLSQHRILLSSLCRYLNTGGTLAALEQIVSSLRTFSSEISIDPAQLELFWVEDLAIDFQYLVRDVEQDRFFLVKEGDFTQAMTPIEVKAFMDEIALVSATAHIGLSDTIDDVSDADSASPAQ